MANVYVILDHGKLVLLDGVSEFQELQNATLITTFSQLQVDHFKVGYVSPTSEIGPYLMKYEFKYRVSCGNSSVVESFQIEVQSVNDHAPDIQTSVLVVKEGKTVLVTTKELAISDSDTILSDITITVCKAPVNGFLSFNGNVIKAEDVITMQMISSLRLR